VGVKQQKSQEELAFMSAGEVKPELVLEEGTETLAVEGKAESQAEKQPLMEVILARENLKQALKRVQGNKGAAGVDGMGWKN
jgi:retron-type reverse transcriptase